MGRIFEGNQILLGHHCRHDCFAGYSKENSCDVYPDIETTSINNLKKTIQLQDGETWILLKDFFDDMNAPYFRVLPEQTETPLIIEGCVRTFADNYINKIPLMESKGISEVWFGVETGDDKLRGKYKKPPFTNSELVMVSNRLRRHGIKVCWYLIKSNLDTPETIKATYNLLMWGKPDKTIESILKGGPNDP